MPSETVLGGQIAMRWLVGVGLLIIGVRNVPEPSSSIEQSWGRMIPWHWLEANWIALACFVVAAILFLYPLLQWWIERSVAKDVRLKIRASLTPGTFHETDAAEVLRYLMHESVWGWRTYARVNFWSFVDGLHLAEFERRALNGDIVTVALSSREGRVVVLERRLWAAGRLNQATVSQHGRVEMVSQKLGAMGTWSQMAVATADLKVVWPPASLGRRVGTTAWVWLKKQWYWLTGVPRMVQLWWRNRNGTN